MKVDANQHILDESEIAIAHLKPLIASKIAAALEKRKRQMEAQLREPKPPDERQLTKFYTETHLTKREGMEVDE